MKGKTNGRGKLFPPKKWSEDSGFPLPSLYYSIKNGELNCYRFGKKIMISEKDWEDFLERHHERKEVEI